MSCPDANTLLDFAGGRLDGRASEALELHLDGCAPCRDLVADLFSGTMRGRPPPVSLRPGDRVDRFVVRECLGRGGMGVVYAAIDPELDRIVAIKLLHRSRELGDEAEDRLVREARAIARVAHPNVVAVFDMGVLDRDHADAVVFVAMERVVGATMRQWLAERERTLDEILAVFRGAAAGLAAAHANGLVHRDFKPDNVMIDADGVAKVMDFGLARLGVVRSEASLVTEIDSDDRLTGTGTLMGTPAYMAPEQHDGGLVDARSDQYAFCAALFEAACGQRPFGQRDHAGLRGAKRAAAFSFPAHVRVPGWLRRVVTRGLSPDPAHRFATMDELAERLRPPRHRVLVATVLVAGAVSVALGLRWSPAVAEGCDTAGSAAALGWDPAGRDAVANSLRDGLAEDATATALREIDGWVDRWVGAHALACAAADDGQLACLASRRAAFAAVVDLLEEVAPGAGARPTEVIGALQDPSECGPDARGDAPVGVHAEAATKIRALRELGRPEDARHMAELAIVAARERGDARGLARLLFELASALEDVDAWPEALAAIEESHHLAQAAGDHETAAQAALRCVSILSSGMPERRTVQLWLRHAEAAVERAGPSDELAIGLGLVRARAADLAGDLPAARAHLELALSAAEDSSSKRLHVVLSNLGVVLGKSGEFAAAIPVYERDREIVVRTYGVDHALVAEVDLNLSGVFIALGEHERALAVLERAEEVERSLRSLRPASLGNIGLNRAYIFIARQDWSGAADEFRRAAAYFGEGYAAGHPSTARALYGLGVSLHNQGRDEEAEALLWQAVEMIEATLGPEHRELLGPIDSIADIAHDRGKFEQAIPLRRRGLAIVTISPMAHDPDAAEVRKGLATDFMELGRWDEAAEQLEDALPVMDTPIAIASGSDPFQARLLLARARLRQGRVDDAIAVLELAQASLGPVRSGEDDRRKKVTEMLVDARRLAAR